MQTLASGDLTALARSAVGFSRVITFEWGFSGAKPQNEAKKASVNDNANPIAQRPDRTCAVSGGIFKGYNP